MRGQLLSLYAFSVLSSVNNTPVVNSRMDYYNTVLAGAPRTVTDSCWPDGLELTPGFYPGSNEQRRLF